MLLKKYVCHIKSSYNSISNERIFKDLWEITANIYNPYTLGISLPNYSDSVQESHFSKSV